MMRERSSGAYRSLLKHSLLSCSKYVLQSLAVFLGEILQRHDEYDYISDRLCCCHLLGCGAAP
jgi:hypothetical protein